MKGRGPVRAAAPSLPVSRRAEVELVRARVRDADAGRPGVVQVRGTHGIGKSALLTLVRDALRDEAAVLSTTSAWDPTDFGVARALFGAAAEAALTASPDDDSRRRRLLGLATEFAGGRPLVVIVDNAHRCDPPTVHWLGMLVRRANGGRVLIVLAFPYIGNAALETVFDDLAGAADMMVIDLAPLSEADVRELVGRTFGVSPHEEFVRVCAELCQGIPNITLDTLGRLAEEGGRPDQVWAVRLREEATATSIDWWSRWFARRTEPVQRYAIAVAVLGAEERLAGALFGLSAATVAAARTTLELVGVFTRNGTYRFEPLPEHLLSALDPRELTELRVKAARLLNDEGRPRREVAEQIVALAEPTEPWMIPTLREAARECADRRDLAVRYLRRALDFAPGDVEIRLELGKALADVDPDAACAVYADVLADVTDAESRAAAATQYGIAAVRTRHARDVVDVVVDAWRALPAGCHPALRTSIETSVLLVGHNQLDTVAAALGHAREIVPPADLRSREARELVGLLAHSELMAGESIKRTMELTRSSLTPAGALHQVRDLLPARALYHCGLETEAMAVVDRVLGSATIRDDEIGHAAALATRAYLRLDRGSLADAVADGERALASPIAGHRPELVRWARTALASVCARNGDSDAVERHLIELGEACDPVEYGAITTARARALHHRGEPVAAVDLLLRCGERFEAMGVRHPGLVPWWVDAVTLLVELGRVAEAVEIAERGADAADRWDTAVTRGYTALARGLVRGDVEALEEAALCLDAAGRRLHELQAVNAIGAALVRRGDHKAARKQLRAAVDLAVGCGDVKAATAAKRALVAAGGRMGELATSVRDVLTGGELRVAELAAGGLTNRQIADALFITVRTVESHLSKVYRKLGVHTRAALVARLR